MKMLNVVMFLTLIASTLLVGCSGNSVPAGKTAVILGRDGSISMKKKGVYYSFVGQRIYWVGSC